MLYDTGKSNSLLCDNLEGWGGVRGKREFPEERDRCIPMADHVDVCQKLTQYCKAIILQLKIFLKNYRRQLILKQHFQLNKQIARYSHNGLTIFSIKKK